MRTFIINETSKEKTELTDPRVMYEIGDILVQSEDGKCKQLEVLGVENLIIKQGANGDPIKNIRVKEVILPIDNI